ncbi:hypothetical protein LAT59_00860 [Candidatus Gracilibacteria bacterium]|nr:hypothetical protein [Candidatus Gracilibacteria bacterium]
MLETASNFEQNQDLYRNIQEALSDSQLTPEEREDILSRYNEDNRRISQETSESFSQLRAEVFEDKKDIYLELRDIFNTDRNDIRKLQTLAGVTIDGLIGPQTFAGLLRLYARFPSLIDTTTSVRQVLESYDEIFNTLGEQFSSKEDGVRRDIQRRVQTGTDGIFGPNTFRSMMQNWDEVKEYFSLQAQGEGQGEILGVDYLESDILSDSIGHDTGESDEQIAHEVGVEQEEVDEIEEEIPEDNTIEVQQVAEGDTSPQDTPTLTEVMTNEEKIERFIEQARGIQRPLIRLLQMSVGTGVDGAFGPLTAQAVIESYPDINDLYDIFTFLNISPEGDAPLSRDGSPEVFRNQYNPFIQELARQFGIPVGLIDAIVGRETDYGANLTHSGGSKGLMQLTNVIFEDMRQPGRREQLFRPLFQRINIENLSSIELGDTTLAGENIPGPIQDIFMTLADPETSNPEFDRNIILLQDYLKGDSTYFNHLTNMIVGSLWLTHHHRQSNGDIYRTARNYNGNPVLREAYGRNIVERYNAYTGGQEYIGEDEGLILNSVQLDSASKWIERRVSEMNLQRLAIYFELERDDNPDFISELALKVAEHQSENGLTVDGKPGNQTLGSIDFGEINLQLLPEDRGEFINSLPEEWQEIGMKFIESLEGDEVLSEIQSLQLFDPNTRKGFVRLPSGDSEIPILCGRGATLRNTVHRVNQIILTDTPHGDASNGANSNTVRAASFISDIAGVNGGKWAPHGVDGYRVSGDYSSMQTLGCIGIESSLMHQIAQETVVNSGASPIGRESRTNYINGTRNTIDRENETTMATRYSIPSGRVYTFTA